MIDNTPDQPADDAPALAAPPSAVLPVPPSLQPLSIEQVQIAVLKSAFPRHVASLLGMLRTAMEPYRNMNDRAAEAWAKVQAEPEYADRYAGLRRESLALVTRALELADEITEVNELSPELGERVTSLLDDIRFQFSAVQVLGEEVSETTIEWLVDAVLPELRAEEICSAFELDIPETDEAALRTKALGFVLSPDHYGVLSPDGFAERFTDCSSTLRWVFPAPDATFSGEFSPAEIIGQLDPERFACAIAEESDPVRGDEDRLRLCIDYLCLMAAQLDKATDESLDAVRFGRMTPLRAVLSEVGSPDAARLASATSGQKRFGIITIDGATIEFSLLIPSILRKRWRDEFELHRPAIQGTFRNVFAGDQVSSDIRFVENVGEGVDSLRLSVGYGEDDAPAAWRERSTESGFQSEEGVRAMERTRNLRPVLAFREFFPELEIQGSIVAIPVTAVHNVDYRDDLRALLPKVVALAARLREARYFWFESAPLFASTAERPKLGGIVISGSTTPVESGLDAEDPMLTALRTMATPFQWERIVGQEEFERLRERDETASLVHLGCLPPAQASIELTESVFHSAAYDAVTAIAAKVQIRYLSLGLEGVRAVRANGESIEDCQARFFGGLLNALTEIEARRGSLEGCALTCGVTELAHPFGRGNTSSCALTYLFDSDNQLIATTAYYRGSTQHEVCFIDRELFDELESRVTRVFEQLKQEEHTRPGVTMELGALLHESGVRLASPVLAMLGHIAGEIPENRPYGISSPGLCLRAFIANVGTTLRRDGGMIALETL